MLNAATPAHQVNLPMTSHYEIQSIDNMRFVKLFEVLM